jgi:hypothetical protein
MTDVTRIVFSDPDGRTTLSRGSHATLRLRDLASAKEVRVYAHGMHPVIGLAIAPDRRSALSG